MPIKPDQELIGQLLDFRKSLHRHPELSGKEAQTASRIRKFLLETKPNQLLEKVGGHGLVAIYDSGLEGPELMLRCDIDALPIQEVNDFEHRSENEGIAHKCGHDGHTAILSGVASLLGQQRPKTGRVALLFQPDEETGRGAEKVLHDEAFEVLKPDMVFALHNLPEFEENAIVVKEGPFASASRGMIITLKGKSSHAAHPEQGNSPLNMLRSLLIALPALPNLKDTFDDFSLVTIIHARLGERAFGTNPGEAVVMATLRSYLDPDMDKLTFMAENLVKHLASKHKIETSIEYTEVFPATVNHPDALETVIRAAEMNQSQILSIREPFRWSEDFGHFTAAYPGALFGIGAGKNHPGLHNNNYDFNDHLIETGVNVFMHIISQKNQFNV
ncbi:MAG: amidohydrolase [Bacteroides sp.]|jgi:amidohydrolase|nr:amidohydrolase [Bacteroides sp.]